MTNPLISVIIPCHNSKPEELRAAIESMLAQTYKNLEIIIIDDHSENDLLPTVQPFLDQYANLVFSKLPDDDPDRFSAGGTNINAGWQARNYGMSIAKGELITFQDDDDGSCSNRLEVQYQLMEKYGANHITVDWQQYQENYNGQRLDYQITDKDIIDSASIMALAKKTKPKLFKHIFSRNAKKDFFEKALRKFDRDFLLDWEPYPGCSGAAMFRKEIFPRCRFRQLYERTRPSKSGRGADRDFNFWVAETFQKSIAVRYPLYLWRVSQQNYLYLDDKYRPR
jgi:glycosyltransferase involved in cell wall biosynthesis